MTKHSDCTICHLVERDHKPDYHKLKCALCKIADKATEACDNPEDIAAATQCLKDILTTASVALILDLIPSRGKDCQ